MLKVIVLLFTVISVARAAERNAEDTRANPNDVPDYVREAQTCSRVDLRPALEKVGFEWIRNRGGRESNFSFAFTEMLGLVIGQAVSARWFEHWQEDHGVTSFSKLQTATRAILAARVRACLESAVPSEDIESSRLARLRLLAKADLGFAFAPIFELFGTKEYARASFTPFSCNEENRTNHRPRASFTLTESKRNANQLIDRALSAKRLSLVHVQSPIPHVYAIAGRRLSASSGRCEYLVRNYEGPGCTGAACEDGSRWVERRDLKVISAWSLEP